jgi:hypothetical protein
LIRRSVVLYIAAGLAAGSCRPRSVARLVPVSLGPTSRDSAIAWIRELEPDGASAIRFRWRYEDERARWAGRGTARIAPPDSVRLDYAGPLGLGSGAGVVVGDSVVWADPADDFRRLVPAIPMLWAAMGMVRPPEPGAGVYTRAESESEHSVRYWRFVQKGGGDTLDYALRSGAERELLAEWTRNGKVIARSVTRYDGGGRPAASRIDLPSAPARMEFSVVAVDTAPVFPPALWLHRH